MRSIKTTVTAAAVLTAGLMMTAPAAYAATTTATAATPQARSACASAISSAQKAWHDFGAAAADLKKQVAAGGHPGTAEEQNLADLKKAAMTARSKAMTACKGMEHHRRHHHPRGAMHTGVGSTSQGVNGGEIFGGMGMLGAAGLGALALRRRRPSSES